MQLRLSRQGASAVILPAVLTRLRSALRLLNAEPGVRRLLVLATVTRLHGGGLGLAVILLIEEVSGSIATAGLATGLLSLGIGLTRPLQGYLIDRFGLPTLGVCAALHAVFAVTLLIVGVERAGSSALALIFALGFSTPAISVATRASWAAHVRARDQPAVFGVDTASLDLALAVGPLIAGLLAAAAGPAEALGALVAIGCLGTWAMMLVAPATVDVRRTSHTRGFHALIPALAASVGFGLIYGSIGVTTVAWVLDDGRPGLAGPIFALIFAGSVIGDLLLAPRRADLPLRRRLQRRLLVLVAATSLLPASPGVALLAIGVAITGAALASASITLLLDIAARTPGGLRAQAYGWAGAALRVGHAAGAAAAGVLVEAMGPRPALLLSTLGATLALVALVEKRPFSAPRRSRRPSGFGEDSAPR